MRLTNIDDSLTVQSDVNLQMMVGNDYIKIKGGIENFVKGNRGNDRFVLHSGKTGQYLGGKGSDTFKIFGGIDNDVYGNKGADRLTLNGGQGRYRGGAGSVRINVLKAEERTVVNGNRGKDYITGSAEGVSYYGGKGQDILAVSQGEVWGGGQRQRHIPWSKRRWICGDTGLHYWRRLC